LKYDTHLEYPRPEQLTDTEKLSLEHEELPVEWNTRRGQSAN